MASRIGRLAASSLVLALLVAAPPALAKGGDGSGQEARVAGRCSAGATSELRLRSRDGTIRMEFVVKRRAPSESWRIVLVHERRVEWRGTLRTSTADDSFRIRRSVRDLAGPDQITTRASGPHGLTCTASATLAG